MISLLLFAGWLAILVVPAWYTLPSRQYQWFAQGILLILAVMMLKSHSWMTSLAVTLQGNIFAMVFSGSVIAIIISYAVLRRTHANVAVMHIAKFSLMVFWVFLPLALFSHAIAGAARVTSVDEFFALLARLSSPTIHTFWHYFVGFTNRATFGNLWLHVVGLMAIALIVSGLAFAPRRWPSGTVWAALSLIGPAFWPGLFAMVPTDGLWLLRILAFTPIVIQGLRVFLPISHRHPWMRLAALVLVLGVAWVPATAASQHTVNPAFPPETSGVLWANRQLLHLDPATANQPDSWLVHVSATATHLASAIAVNNHAALLPGTMARPRTSWHPVRLTPQLANQALNQQLNKSLVTTNVIVLIVAVVVLFLALGSLPAAGMAVGLGGVTSLVTLAILRGLETFWPISPYALNIADLLAMGLSIDYAVFQIHAFRQKWMSLPSLPDEKRADEAQSAAIAHAQSALPWSAAAMLFVLAVFPLALPGGLGWSFALGGATAAITALVCSQFLVVALLHAYPTVWFRVKLPVALSDVLDHAYRHVGKWSVLWPGVVFLATFVAMLGVDRIAPKITLYTPSNSAQLLPTSNTIYQAFDRQPLHVGKTAFLVIQTPTQTSWTTTQSILQKLPVKAGVIWGNPLASLTVEQLTAISAQPKLMTPALRSVWSPAQHLVRISVTSHGTLPRAEVSTVLYRVLPSSWQWSLTGQTHAVQATSNAWFQQALWLLLAAGVLVSAVVRWLLTQRMGSSLLAVLFELMPLLTTVVLYLVSSHLWPNMLPHTLPFPILLIALSLMLALALDYQILFTHTIGNHITTENIENAVAKTGGSITSAGAVMACSFYVLLLSPLPFLRSAGFLIGTNVLLDTLVIRTLLMPTTFTAFLAHVHHKSWIKNLDHILAIMALVWAIIAIPTILVHDRRGLAIQPKPIPVHTIATAQHPLKFL